jgi:hypothetical protein
MVVFGLGYYINWHYYRGEVIVIVRSLAGLF